MRRKIPNYLYPLKTENRIQWEEDVLRGSKKASKDTIPLIDKAKMSIVRSLVQDKQMSLRYGKPLKTASYSNPMMKEMRQRAPMKDPSPRPLGSKRVSGLKSNY